MTVELNTTTTSTNTQDELPPDESRFYQTAVVVSIGYMLALFLVAARLFTRAYLLRVTDWSDFVLAFAMLLNTISTSMELAAGAFGAGRHVYYVDPSDLAKASLLGTAGVPFSQFSMALPKIAAVGVLVRIAGPHAPKWIKYYLFTMTGILTLLTALYSIFLFVQCDPPFALWTQVPGARCWNPLVTAYFGLAMAVFSAFIDINIAIYPIFIMRRLQMETRKKISICILMGLGLSATICAGFKIPHLQDQANRDITWAVVPLTCWTSAELNVMMIAASVPLLRPLWLWACGKPIKGGSSSGNNRRTERKGFRPFGSKKDTRNEMTIDIGLQETTSPRSGNARALLTPPPKDFDMTPSRLERGHAKAGRGPSLVELPV